MNVTWAQGGQRKKSNRPGGPGAGAGVRDRGEIDEQDGHTVQLRGRNLGRGAGANMLLRAMLPAYERTPGQAAFWPKSWFSSPVKQGWRRSPQKRISSRNPPRWEHRAGKINNPGSSSLRPRFLGG